MPRITLAELSEVYLGVLEVTDDPETRVLVLERLAGIEMLQAEARLADGDETPALFDEAIDPTAACWKIIPTARAGIACCTSSPRPMK